MTELTCWDCGKTEEMVLVSTDGDMRGYLPPDIDESQDYDFSWVSAAHDGMVEETDSGMVLCNICAAKLAADDIAKRDGQELNFDADI